jgi:hypothetical protein
MKVPITAVAHHSRPPPPPPDPIKGYRHSGGPPHPFTSPPPPSIVPAPWLLGAKASSPVHHLLAVARASVSGPPIVPRRALPVATLAASHRGLERPLGRAPTSPGRWPLWGPRWNHGPATPAWSTNSWTWSTGFPLEKQFLEIPIFGILPLGPSTFSISTRSP